MPDANPAHPPHDVGRLVDGLFRRASGRLVSTLTRKLGAHHLDLAQECVQDALTKALQAWPFGGLPEEPEAWLYRVAVNRALDVLRHENLGREKLSDPAVLDELARDDLHSRVDDELAMMFMCCHPDLPSTHRLALTLKTVGGLSVEEVAAGFLVDPNTMAQRIVRAKRQLRDQRIVLDVPDPADIASRLESILEVIYLLFNEGYAAHSGGALIKADLCAEAIRLARVLVSDPRTNQPSVRALLALMLFHTARQDSRVTAEGELLLLADQDRTRWNTQLLAEAFRCFEASFEGPKTVYHVEAAIASVHAAAPSFAHTNWSRVRALYDELVLFKPTPVAALNRAIALGYECGPEAGLAALGALETDPHLARYHLLPAAQGAFLSALGQRADAADRFRHAITLARSAPERRWLEARLASCLNAAPSPA